MRSATSRATVAVIAVAVLAASTPAFPRPQSREPVPQGRRISADDGDLIVVDHDARVGFVRRRQASIRLIYNAAQRWVALLADYAPPGSAPDGLVDFTFSWRQLEGTWPLGERWEGNVILEDYSAPGSAPNSIAIVLPEGRLQFLNRGPAEPIFADPRALAVLRYGSAGGGLSGRVTFDQAEDPVVRNAVAGALNPSVSTSTAFDGAVAGGVTATTTLTATRVPPSTQAAPQDPNAPVRVGSTLVTPKKTHDVAPIYPESMRTSGVTGIVILELTVEKDGTVRSAKLLRGVVAAIDQAALDAARQWRYEPVMLNGAPVAVILTATVLVTP